MEHKLRDTEIKKMAVSMLGEKPLVRERSVRRIQSERKRGIIEYMCA